MHQDPRKGAIRAGDPDMRHHPGDILGLGKDADHRERIVIKQSNAAQKSKNQIPHVIPPYHTTPKKNQNNQNTGSIPGNVPHWFQPVNVLSRRVTELKQWHSIRTTTTFDQLAVSTPSGCSRKNESKCLANCSLYSLIKQPRTDVCRGNAGRGVQQYVESVESVESVEDIRGICGIRLFIAGNVTFCQK